MPAAPVPQIAENSAPVELSLDAFIEFLESDLAAAYVIGSLAWYCDAVCLWLRSLGCRSPRVFSDLVTYRLDGETHWRPIQLDAGHWVRKFVRATNAVEGYDYMTRDATLRLAKRIREARS